MLPIYAAFGMLGFSALALEFQAIFSITFLAILSSRESSAHPYTVTKNVNGGTNGSAAALSVDASEVILILLQLFMLYMDAKCL